MNAKVYQLIDSYEQSFVETLARWIRVPSLKDEPAEGAPFGKEVRRMLDMAMADAEGMGFPVRNVDGYACDVTLGSEEQEMIAVLGHLDVVPAGDGWQVDPFGAVIDGDKMYGRGTIDDKGPTLAAMFAMKAIKEAGIPLKRGIRLIMGCDEESGWADMAYYTSHMQMPEIGFSPDASFPLINTEKGTLRIHVRGKLSNTGLQVKQLWTGERTNVIPGECIATVAGDQAVADAANAFAARTGLPYDVTMTADGVTIKANGIPGHSAYPENCRNAIGMMLLMLRELGVQGDLLTLANVYPMEYTGAALGIACEDEISGSLTCNMGILHIEDGGFFATFDCRCPIKADLEQLKANALTALTGLTIETAATGAPHHVPADSELVTALLAAYQDETGITGIPQSTGGGTYAKVLKSGVAFGAAFPDEQDLAHQAGEFIYIPYLMKAMKIYANALLRLCAE